jgi:hypothetical protein
LIDSDSKPYSRALDGEYAQAFAGRHPMELVRTELKEQRVLSAAESVAAPDGKMVTVAGLVITRQRPGNGTIIYVTVEGETKPCGRGDPREGLRGAPRAAASYRRAKIRGRVVSDGAARNVSSHVVEHC